MKLTSERRLLLCCAQSRPTGVVRRQIKDLATQDIDWNQLAAASCAHGIAPLIYYNLREASVTGVVSPKAAQALHHSYYFNAARSALIQKELGQILKVFHEKNIQPIALKGAPLAELVYSDRSLRPMLDIDLLVRRPQLGNVERELAGMGYQLGRTEGSREQHLNRHYHWVYEKRTGITIEIHWHVKRPTDPFDIDIEAMWKRSRPVKLAGIEALVFSPEDFLLHLCQHFWKHKLIGGIRPLCDIGEAVRFYGDEIDWIKLASLSREWKMNHCSYLVLRLARELMDAPIPESVFKELKPVHFNEEIAHWAMETVLGYGECPPVFPDLLRLFWKGASVKDRWVVLQKALSRRTVAAYDNTASATASRRVYYLSRIKHLLTQYGPTVALLWTGNRKMRAAAETQANQELLLKWLRTDGQKSAREKYNITVSMSPEKQSSDGAFLRGGNLLR